MTRLIPAWLKRLITTPRDQLTRWQRVLRFGIDVTRHCTGELRHDKAGQMAAALTYHTLFSLLPTIVLAMVILHGFVRVQDREQFKDFVVDLLLPQTALTATETAPDDRIELADARQELADRVEGLMDRIATFNLGGVGVVGLLVFIYGATALLDTVERIFNSVFAVRLSRPWYLRLPLYYTVITLAPLMLILGQVVQAKLLDLLEAAPWMGWLTAPAAYILPFFAVWLVFFLLYVLLPNTTVPKHAAAVGSFVGALVWVIAKELFQLYVSHAAISTFYGALALLPLFLFWLWLSWVIILFGLELTYTLSAMRERRFKYEAYKELEQQVIDPMWLVPIAARIAEAFQHGRSVSAGDLADMLNTTRKSTQNLLEALLTANIIVQVHRDDQSLEQYSLARPASEVRVKEVLDAAEHLLPEHRGKTDQVIAWRFVRQLHSANQTTAANVTLAELIGESGEEMDEVAATEQLTD